MSDGNSWCTCRKKFPQGYDTKGCPVHDRPGYDEETIARLKREGSPSQQIREK